MVINTDKTKVMMITTQQRWLKLEKKEPDVFIRGRDWTLLSVKNCWDSSLTTS